MKDKWYFSTLMPTSFGIVAGSNKNNNIYLVDKNDIKTFFFVPECERYINISSNRHLVFLKFIEKQLNQQAAFIVNLNNSTEQNIEDSIFSWYIFSNTLIYNNSFDIYNSKILTYDAEKKMTKSTYTTENLRPSIYFLQLKTDKNVFSQKI